MNVNRNYIIFFFKQKTAYEMRISDWSSDVCSSDLSGEGLRPHPPFRSRRLRRRQHRDRQEPQRRQEQRPPRVLGGMGQRAPADRKSVVKGKSVSVRVDLGGRRIIKKKKENEIIHIRQIVQTTTHRLHTKSSEYSIRQPKLIT